MGSVGMQFPNALWAYLRRSRSVLRRETINFDVRYPVDRLDSSFIKNNNAEEVFE